MLSAKFKPKRTAAVSRGFLETARLSCYLLVGYSYCFLSRTTQQNQTRIYPLAMKVRYMLIMMMMNDDDERIDYNVA